MGYAYEILGRYKQKVVDESELNAAAKNLEKALQTGNYKKYGWGAVEKPLAGYKFSSEVEKTHFLEQVKLMLKLWGTGPIGKNTVSAIVEKCLAANDNLQNVGAYARGSEIKDAKGKKIGEVKDTNPVVVGIGEYRRKNDLGITQETVAAKVEAGAGTKKEALKGKPKKMATIGEEEVGKTEEGAEESEEKEPEAEKATEAEKKEAGKKEEKKSDEQTVSASAQKIREEDEARRKKIIERYGKDGKKVLELIDGERSEGEISKASGVAEEKVKEIINALNEPLEEPAKETAGVQIQENAFLKSLKEAELGIVEVKYVLIGVKDINAEANVTEREIPALWEQYKDFVVREMNKPENTGARQFQDYVFSNDLATTASKLNIHISSFNQYVALVKGGATEITWGDVKEYRGG